MDVVQNTLNEALALHKRRDYGKASHLYNALLNLDPFNEGYLFLLSDLYLRQEYTGLAINLLTNLLDKNPKSSEGWCNLGIAYRKENRYQPAINCWEKALEIKGDTVEVCSNMAGIYADRAQPEQALHWLDRALACDPENTEAHWQRGLALLTMRHWAEGWDEYEYRQKLENWHCRDTVTAPIWDFSPTEHLYIHGEQGIGDEVMFLSVLPDVLPLAKQITVEVHPAVAQIVRETWPGIGVVTDETPGNYTAKIPLASLAARLRRDDRAFPGVSYLTPFQERVEHYKERLRQLGPRPWIAIAWHGGTRFTRVQDRSVRLEQLAPILGRFTCVSAQYEHTNPLITEARERHGLVKLDDECLGRDIAAQAALFKAVDAVVTVQQTAVHVAGSVGAKTFALIGSQPHWRYGLAGDLPWYKSVKLYRQKTDWEEVIGRVEKDIANQFRVQRAKSTDARAA